MAKRRVSRKRTTRRTTRKRRPRKRTTKRTTRRRTAKRATRKRTRKPKKAKKVQGFEANARRIAKRQGISLERARAILAAGARRASPAAKRRNPRLKRVKGKAKK